MILTQGGTNEIQRIDIHTLKCVEKYDIHIDIATGEVADIDESNKLF